MRKKHLKFCINYFIIAIFSVVFYSCSTQKDKFLNRSYHKTTAKFNGYFNGKESLKEAISKLEKTYQEDYNNLLPTTILGDQKQAQKIYPQLNRTIDKASLVIERHSMEIKRKEKNKWITKCCVPRTIVVNIFYLSPNTNFGFIFFHSSFHLNFN